MNKNQLFYLLLFTFFTFPYTSFSQEVSLTNEVNEIRQPLIGSWNGIMVFEQHKTVGGSLGYAKSSYLVDYILLDTKTNTSKEIESRPSNALADKSNHMESIVHDQYIYEVHSIEGKTNFGSVGIIKRDIETGDQVGEILFLNQTGELKSFEHDEDGMHLLLTKQEGDNYIFRIDYDLSIVWNQKLDILADKSVSVSSVSVDEDGNFLISVLIKEEVKTNFFGNGPRPKSGLAFVIVDINGEIRTAVPEFPFNIYALSARFKYYPEKDELAGIFIITEILREQNLVTEEKRGGIGYVYSRWNSEGEIIASNKHMFTPKELENEELSKFLEVTKFNLKKIYKDNKFEEVAFGRPLKFIFSEEGNVIVASNDFYCGLTEISNSKLVFSVSDTGTLNWIKFIPYGPNDNYKNSGFFLHDNKLHLFVKEFSRNFENGTYNFKYFRDPLTPISVQYCDRIINCSNGTIESYKPLLVNTVEKFLPNIVAFNNSVDQVILRYSFTVKNLERYLVLDFK